MCLSYIKYLHLVLGFWSLDLLKITVTDGIQKAHGHHPFATPDAIIFCSYTRFNGILVQNTLENTTEIHLIAHPLLAETIL